MFCASCGVELPLKLNYCNKCGADLQPPVSLISSHEDDNRSSRSSASYTAIAIGFSSCIGIVALAVAAVKMAQMGVDGFGIGVFALACAGIIISIAHLLAQMMIKINGKVTDDNQQIRARQKASTHNAAKMTTTTITPRALDEHRETFSPFSSVTDRTTKIFEPARKQESGEL